MRHTAPVFFPVLTVVLTLATTASTLYGQNSDKPAGGFPEDWSHHHVMFANPGTAADALRKGTLDHWSRITNDRRYQILQLRQNLLERRLAAANPAARQGILKALEEIVTGKLIKASESNDALKRDWNMDLGANATVGAGQYPAKFSFDTTTASCSDWVGFNTGTPGASGGQSNIIAYSNLYEGTCSGATPTVNWAYYSGTGSALTSPVLSLDGSKIAYVENATSGATLRIIAWHAGEGTSTAAAMPDHRYTNTTAGAAGNTAWNSTNCPTSGSCMISVAFQNNNQDTNSAPFYLYDGSDTMFVGDSSGKLHKFTGVFTGTPAEVTSGGWPIAVSTNVLTSPVYDSGTSGNLFVADSGGFLYSYKASTAALVMKSSKLTYAGGTVGIADGPLLDSTTEQVYVFVGQDANTQTTESTPYNCEQTTGCSGVFQFAAGGSTIGTGACDATSATAWSGTNCGEEAVFGTGTTATPNEYDGAFDHIYQVGAGKTGNLWVCAPHVLSQPRLSYVILQSNGGIVPSGDVIYFTDNVVTAVSTLTNGVGACSPVTEIWGSDGTTNDYLFMSVTANGNLTTTTKGAKCSGACLYNFVIATGGTSTTAGTLSAPSTAYAGIPATGGTSGIIVDNTVTATSESQIYYTNLSNTACTGNGSTGAGTGGCAVQTSQTVP